MGNPGIYFFPLSVPESVRFLGIDAGVLARRIPDFLCLCLNDDAAENVGLLEIRAADADGTPTGAWASLSELPDPQLVLDLLPDEGVDVAIIGTLGGADGAAIVELTLVRRPAAIVSQPIEWSIDATDPAASLLGLAQALADELGMSVNASAWNLLGTRNTYAFLSFLQGLDGWASIDPDFDPPGPSIDLLRPFVHAIEQDPEFGLALRRLHVAVQDALSIGGLEGVEALELCDEAYATYPSDHEAAACIGEHLVQIGEERRAEDWFRLATACEDPPGTALESLGILLANRGDTAEARQVWRTGARTDGHPDFLAHLARLGFAEKDDDEAWDKMIRGLRRIAERALHPGEWGEDEGRGGVLLRYLGEHLEDRKSCKRPAPPPAVGELLIDLCEQITEPRDRLELGICLTLVGRKSEGVAALRATIPHVEDPDRRDIGGQYLAENLFEEFNDRMGAVAQIEEPGDEADEAIRFLDEVASEIPQFWPATYYVGRLAALSGRKERAYEAYRRTAMLRRDQSEILRLLAACAHGTGRLEEAVEAILEAIQIAPDNPVLHADCALLLYEAGELAGALSALDEAETLDPSHEAVRRAAKTLRRGEGAA